MPIILTVSTCYSFSLSPFHAFQHQNYMICTSDNIIIVQWQRHQFEKGGGGGGGGGGGKGLTRKRNTIISIAILTFELTVHILAVRVACTHQLL